MSEFATDCGFLNAMLAFSFVILTLIIFCNMRNRNLPPGPIHFPVVGNIFLLLKGDILKSLRKLRSQYGDIYSLKLGSYNAVVVNGYETLKEFLTKRGDETSDRPDLFAFREITRGQGLLGSCGSLWKTQRAFALTTLRGFGLGKQSIESRIMREVEIFLQVIESKQGKPFNIDGILDTSIANIICSIIFGKRFEYDDKRFTELLELIKENFRLVGPGALMNFFPILEYVPGDPCKGKLLLKNTDKLLRFFDYLVEEHSQSYDADNVKDYIDAYLKEMKQNRSTFTALQLSRSLLDLFIGGTETSTTVIKWAILFFLHNPNVQDKMRQELDTVIGISRTPSLSDRKKLPYCEAVIAEVLRCANVAPLSVLHSCPCDVSFRGFTIPKGTIIIPNLDSVVSDSNVFKNAEIFYPERFIDENGQVYGQEKVVAFSIGRRVCLGESLARSELFLYLTSMVQRFYFKPLDENNLPSLEGNIAFSRTPNEYEFIALKRL